MPMTADVSRALAAFISRMGLGRDAARTLADQYGDADALPEWLTEHDDPTATRSTSDHLHVLDNGVCTTCTASVQRNFDPNEPRDPHTGEWGLGGAAEGAVKDALKLADRIQLGTDEKFAGSGKVRDKNGDVSAVLAGVDSPSGRKVRLGLVLPEHEKAWRGADKGGTVELDKHSAAQLRETLSGAAEAGRDSVKSYYADVRKAHAADLPADEWPDPEAEIASGTIRAGWGDLKWTLQRDADTGPEISGIDAPGAGWSLGLQVVSDSGSPRGVDPMYIDTPAKAKALQALLAELAGNTAATRSAPSHRHVLVNGICTTCTSDVQRHFNPSEPRVPGGEHGGEWGAGGAVGSALKDTLKLAGKIDLGQDEKLVGSAKVDGDMGSIRMALTDTHGVKTLRLGLGGPGFGGREDEAGPWRGSDKVAELNAERKKLSDEEDSVTAELDKLDSDPHADPARKAALHKRLDELLETDRGEVYAAGHTVNLDQVAAGHLHAELTRAAADGAAKYNQVEKDLNRTDELDKQLDAMDAVPSTGGGWTPEMKAKYATLLAERQDLAVKLRAEDYSVFAEGSVPGANGEVQYRVEYDDHSVGVKTILGAIPTGSGLELTDLTGDGTAAELDPAETTKVLRLLSKYASA